MAKKKPRHLTTSGQIKPSVRQADKRRMSAGHPDWEERLRQRAIEIERFETLGISLPDWVAKTRAGAPTDPVVVTPPSKQQEAADRAALASILEQVILKNIGSDYDCLEDLAEVAAGAFRSGLDRYDLKHRPHLPTPVNAEAADELTMLHDQLQKAQLALVEYKVRAMTACACVDIQRAGTVSTPMCFSTEWVNRSVAEISRLISEAGR